MEGSSAVSFAGLLRRLRTDAGLTQEELAEAASLSPRSVSDLERGINLTARRETARLLADALSLAGPARAAFEAAARGRLQASESPVGWGAAATRTLPRDIGSFTGRDPEFRQLADVAAGSGGVVGVHAIGGMAGVGKTAFAVHAAHQLCAQFPDGQVFLPLHGHTPGQRPVDPADALASLLLTAGVAAGQIPPGVEARTALWRHWLAGKRLLLVLDDAASSEQIQPLLPGTAGSLVLVTSRRHLTALDDAYTISLDILSPGEAGALLIRLAARPGLEPGAPVVEELTRLCGYLPLAVGMLARQLHHHPGWTPADLAADLAAARDRLEFMRAENLSVAAAFDLSYQDLTGAQQRLFRRLGLHPGTDIDAYAAAALDGIDLGTARRHLAALYDQYLLAEPAHGRYRFHDLIREHARTIAAADPPADQEAASDRLLNYYLHTARAADRHLVRRMPPPVPDSPVTQPADTPALLTRHDAVTWMDADRLNLHAAASHAATRNRPGHAVGIPAAVHEFLRSYGHWDQAIALHHVALEAARRVGDQLAEAGVLTDLGRTQRFTGDYRAAGASLQKALDLFRGLDDQLGEAGALNRLGVVQRDTGDYPAATASLTRALYLYRELGNLFGQSSALTDLGLLQRDTGDYPAAIANLTRAAEMYCSLGNRLGQANARAALGGVQQVTGDYSAAAENFTRALELYRSLGSPLAEAQALRLQGTVQHINGDPAAAGSLTRALELYRDFSDSLGRANALNRLGLVQRDSGQYPAAADSFTRALQLYRWLGNRLMEADTLNTIGEMVRLSASPAHARDWHEQAFAIADDLGAPLEQARALEGLGRIHLQDGRHDDAAERMRRALEIYQRIRSPHARRVEAAIRDHGL